MDRALQEIRDKGKNCNCDNAAIMRKYAGMAALRSQHARAVSRIVPHKGEVKPFRPIRHDGGTPD